MKPITEKSDRFKSKGAEILSQNQPYNVESFLNAAKPSETKPISPQNHIRNKTLESSSKLGRLHIEVRLDLVKQLMQRVFKRKCDPDLRGRATQRAIIEEALEEYFRRHTV
jgi:hypothetical protein